jgi:hypothetical protein
VREGSACQTCVSACECAAMPDRIEAGMGTHYVEQAQVAGENRRVI